MKKLFLVGICLFLTGCSVEFNLDINDSTFSENISILGNNDDEISQIQEYDNPIFAFLSEANYDGDSLEDMEKFSFYDRKLISSGIGLSFDYGLLNYHDSYVINYCYNNFSAYRDDDGIVSLITGSRFNCMDYYLELDEVVVNLDVRYDVIDSNADNVNGNIYSWVINRSNYRNKNIYLVYDSGKEKFSLWKFLSDNIYYVGIVTILVIILVIYLILKKNSDAKNVI